MKKIIAAVAVIIILFAGYVYYSPYLAVKNLSSAVEEQNADKVSEYIDFDSLRVNINDQFKAAIMKKVLSDKEMQDNPFAVLAMGFVNNMVEGLTTVIVSPDGLTKLMAGKDPFTGKSNAGSNGSVENPSESTSITNMKDGKGSYIDYSHFQVVVSNKKNQQMKLIFERQGLTGWKMKKMIFPDVIF